MELLIIGHAAHIKLDGKVYSYGPYVREMNLWTKHVDTVRLVVPVEEVPLNDIHLSYDHEQITLIQIPAISLTSVREILKTLLNTPIIFFRIIAAMRKAHHIHLRCPGNIALLGCIAQIFFPKKPKTAKYAGNWDPNSKQPRSYRLQKWLLSNTFLTKNLQALVYGDWPNLTKNIKPFFTATYYEHKIPFAEKRSFQAPFKFVFVGSLAPGKQPLYAVKLIAGLLKKGVNVSFELYGEGPEREALEAYIEEFDLKEHVKLRGNRSAESIETAYKESHFLILPSKSEGWPKVVAEAMFWGCLPVVTPVSCVDWMVDQGGRGILISENIDKDIERVLTSLKEIPRLEEMSDNAKSWSHQYTLNKFEEEVEKLLR